MPLAEKRHDLLPDVAPALGVEPLATGPEEEPLLEPPEVAQRIRQAVGMVDPEPRHAPLARQRKTSAWVMSKIFGSSVRRPASSLTSKNRR